MTELAQAGLAATISEAELSRTVTEMLTAIGWRWCHFRPARTGKGWRTPVEGDPGWFDIVAARDGRVLFIELKAQRGRLTFDELVWARAMGQSHEVYCWRPSDLLDDTIGRVLATYGRPLEAPTR